MKNIIFMGTPSYAVQILKALIEANFNILAVLSQPDKAVGRKQELRASAVKEFVLNFNASQGKKIEIFTPKSLKESEIYESIRALKPNFIVVAAYGKILPKNILDLAPCINLHASLLPKYRGASPIQSAILNADAQSGVCSMLMNEGLDTGEILKSKAVSIKDKKAEQVFLEFGELAAQIAVETLQEFKELTPVPQDEREASFCVKVQKKDGLIDIKKESARGIYQKFLAFYPWPGVFLENGLKLIELELFDENETHEAGKLVKIEKEGFLLACQRGILKIKKIQEAGKKVLEAQVYCNGKRLKDADYLC